MTSNDPQQPVDGTYDETMIRPVESAPASPAPTADDATTVLGSAQAPAAPSYPAPSNPYEAANPYAAPANPYGAPADPYAAPANPYAAPANPYDAPPAYPGQQLPSYPAPGYPAYPGQNLPGYPGYGQATAGTNGLAIASLVCGIISIVLFCLWGVGVIVGIAGLVMGFIGMNQIKEKGENGHGLALAGLITSGIGTLFSLGFLVLLIIDAAG